MKYLFCTLFLLYLATYSFAQNSPYENLSKDIQAQDLKKDIDTWFDWLHATHPDLSYTVKSIDKFYKDITQIKDSINTPLTVLEFWKRISPLNNHLSDGHLIVGHINAGVVRDFISKGGTFFPFEVVFNKNELLIATKINGESSEFYGYSISSINNIPIQSIIDNLIIRINGDSYEQRKVLLQRKFALFNMLYYGESKEFSISIKKGDDEKTVLVKGISSLPSFYKPTKFDDNFRFEVLNNKNALLTVKEFGWDDKKVYYDFMDSVFTTLNQKKIKHLIIDVRENGGGDDEFWMNGILKYIADKPYRWGSSYKKKIIGKYKDPGEVIGTVVSGEIDTLISPTKKIVNKFEGKVSVLIGPYTYSSAILFVNTVQDYKFGNLVGEPTGGKSGQTGAIQFSTMPNSGLTMIAPRFYLARPKDNKQKEPVMPDTLIEYDKLDLTKIINSVKLK
jgi:C-terminal processing protease CtpA/Prc